jgi:hypothetical protein
VTTVDDRTMFQRQRQEKEEGKVYNDPEVKHFFITPSALILTQEIIGFG